MDRLQKFHSLKTHPWYSKLFEKLSSKDLEFCLLWIGTKQSLSKNEFEFQANRLFLDQPKPKNWKLICEIIATSN